MRYVTITNPEFVKLKDELARFPRRCGYYLFDVVSVSPIPEDDAVRDLYLDDLFRHFDDKEWPPLSDYPTDQTWDCYECGREEAATHVVEALVGGPAIGHTRKTISPDKALGLWYRFESLFTEPRRYYMRIGFGSVEMAFQHGSVIIGGGRAGLLCIAESD